jgi:hypothetical protein
MKLVHVVENILFQFLVHYIDDVEVQDLVFYLRWEQLSQNLRLFVTLLVLE